MFPLILAGRVVDLSAAQFDVNEELTWGPEQAGVLIGDYFDGTTYTHPAPVVVAPVVPQSVSKVQAVLALHAVPSPTNSGKTLLDDVEATVAAATDPRVPLAWTNAYQIDRHGLFVVQLAPTIPGLETDAQLDALFTAAAQISV